MHPRFHLFTKTLLSLTTRLHHLFFFFLTVKAEAEVEEAHQTFLPLNENPIKTPLSLYFSSKLSKTLSLSLNLSLSPETRKEREKKEGEEETQKKKKQVLKTQKTLF